MADLSFSSVSQKRLEIQVAWNVLADKSDGSATEHNAYLIPPNNTTTKMNKSQVRSSAFKSSTKNNTMYTQELLIALRGIVGVPGVSQKEKEGRLLKLVASVPFSPLHCNGGEGGVYYPFVFRWMQRRGTRTLNPDLSTSDNWPPASGCRYGKKGNVVVNKCHIFRVYSEGVPRGVDQRFHFSLMHVHLSVVPPRCPLDPVRPCSQLGVRALQRQFCRAVRKIGL